MIRLPTLYRKAAQAGTAIKANILTASLLAAGVLATSQLAATLSSSAQANDGWNPFAEQDRAAARERRRRARNNARSERDRRPYLEPLAPGERPAPQTYSTNPPRFGANNAYQPPGQGPRRPPAYPPGTGAATIPGSVPYGAPGTYMPGPTSGASNFAAQTPGVERGELTPVISAANALPAGVWQQLDAAGAEQLLRSAPLPPASTALNDLFTRIMAEPVANQRLNAVRATALIRAGRFEQATKLLAAPSSSSAAVGGALDTALLDLATGASDAGCRKIKAAVAKPAKLPRQARGEAIALAGYCAIVAGNPKAGELAADLARDAGYNRPFVLALLQAVGDGSGTVRAPMPNRVSVIEALLVQQLKQPDPTLIDGLLKRADAGFLALVAGGPEVAPALRLKATERAAAAYIVSPAVLADVYRAAAQTAPGGAKAARERARQFVTAEQSRAQFARTRALRALLDSARRDGLYTVTAMAAAPMVRTMRPAQEISWFNETAIEILAAGTDYAAARQWVEASTGVDRRGTAGPLDHWSMLLDIADPQVRQADRGRSIHLLENLALQGRFSPEALHRLATVLDALDYNVPIPLWNLASRTEQPQTGHLPETGMLSAMKQASEGRQIAATTLYALRTIAPSGTAGTHLLGLGETIRALKRAGLEKDARRLGFEALFIAWPRSG